MINSFVYKFKQRYILVPMVSEKKILLENNTDIFKKCDNGKPLKDNSIALCGFDHIPPNKYNIKPVAIVNLSTVEDDKAVDAHTVIFDDLVSFAFKAAHQFTQQQKQKEALNKKAKKKQKEKDVS